MKARRCDDSPLCAPRQHHELQQWLQNQPSPRNVHLATPATSRPTNLNAITCMMSPYFCKLQLLQYVQAGCSLQGKQIESWHHITDTLECEEGQHCLPTTAAGDAGSYAASLQLTFRGHQSGLQGVCVKKLGRAFRLKPERAPKGLLPLFWGPQPESVTPVDVSLSATLWSSILVA